jgi:formate dehydrogenase assembly factor FdhD
MRCLHKQQNLYSTNFAIGIFLSQSVISDPFLQFVYVNNASTVLTVRVVFSVRRSSSSTTRRARRRSSTPACPTSCRFCRTPPARRRPRRTWYRPYQTQCLPILHIFRVFSQICVIFKINF